MALPPSTPPSSVSTGAVPSGAPPRLQQLGEVVVEQVPPRIAQLARTIVLTGMVVEQQSGGALVLRTQVGELVIRSASPLPLDQILSLQIPPGAPPVRAQISVALPVLAGPHAQAQVQAQTQNTTISTGPGAAAQGSTPLPVITALPAGAPSVSVPPGAVPQPSLPTTPLAPALGLAASAAAQAIDDLPLQPGSVLPAQVMALPDPIQNFMPTRSWLPASVQVFAELQKIGAPALQALLPHGLSDVLAHLSAPIMAPTSAAPARADMPGLANAPATSMAPTAGAASAVPVKALAPMAIPAFSSLPVMLTVPPGAQVTVQVLAVHETPISNAASKTGAASAPVPVPTAEAAPVRAALTPAQYIEAPSVPPAAGDAVQSSPVPATKTPPTFTAVVIGQTPHGQPMATSPAGLIVLENRAPLPAGTLVELSFIHIQEAPPEADITLPASPRDWPALQEVQALQPQTPPAMAVHLAKPESVGGVAAFLVAALKLNQPEKMLGDELVSKLRASGQENLISRVAAEVQQAGQSFVRENAPAQEWRTLALPVLPDGQLARLAVHLRAERDPEAPSVASPIKHLVVEVELSRLGPLLLDGYIRPRRFDVMLRSQRRLPRTLRDELRLAYRDALQALGWQGGLEFQTAAELWLGTAEPA